MTQKCLSACLTAMLLAGSGVFSACVLFQRVLGFLKDARRLVRLGAWQSNERASADWRRLAGITAGEESK